jgi:N-methylhydantoinase B/oxoprolinase/acetone carboxylase alpha subunit
MFLAAVDDADPDELEATGHLRGAQERLVTVVDEMAEQILRTGHSFVIYSRDFSCALCDANGDTVMQGSQDIAVHVGTLHLKAKAVLKDFGEDIHEGDVFAVNDPYRGGTHFPDVSLIRPVFPDGEMIALAQANGHWADVGGSVPGSFDVGATDHFGEGVRIPPVRVVDRGVTRNDVIAMIASNSRSPGDIVGDCHAQIEATRVAESELFRLIDKYGRDTVVAAFGEVQDYVEGLTRARIAELEDGSWETTDYIDFDPRGDEGLVAVRLKLTISGDEVHYDLSGSDPVIASFLNAGAGVASQVMPSGRWRVASTSSTCSSAAVTPASRTGRSSCGTTGWPVGGAGARAVTARTAPRRCSASGSPSSRSRARSASHRFSPPTMRSSPTPAAPGSTAAASG